MGINLPFQFTFPGSEWVVLILSTTIYSFYGGKPFLSGGKDEIAKTRYDDLSCSRYFSSLYL